MEWFSLWLDAGMLTGMGVLQLYFVGRFTARTTKPWHYAVYLFTLCLSSWTAIVLDSSWLGTVLMILATYWMSRLALGNGSLVSWTASIIAVHVLQLAFGLLNPFQVLFFPLLMGKPLLPLLVVLSTLLAFGGGLFCFTLILRCFSPRAGHCGPALWLLLPPGLFLFAVETYLLRTVYGSMLVSTNPVDMGQQIGMLGLQLLGLGTLLCTLYAYRRTCDGFAAQAALASLTQETGAQRTYVAQAQLRYERTRAFRHDLKNHLSVLEGLLKRGETAQAGAYLGELNAATGELSFPACTGNPVVDILLGDKLALAQGEGVAVEAVLTLPHPAAPVEDFDLCVIFANALDNALRACQQVEGEKSIRVSGQRQGDFYLLEFENSCLPDVDLAMGTGLSNVQSVAEKYGGTMTVERRSEQFRLSVLLNISGQPEDHSRQIPCSRGETR